LIPGLNLRPGSADDHAYKIVPKENGNGYEVTPVNNKGGNSAYDLIPINAETLAAIGQDDEADPADSLPGVLPSDVPPEYKIGPGDIIYVTVWDHPELTSPYTATVNDPSVTAIEGRLVASDGVVFYPYVGAFKAAGMTAAEVRDYLSSHLTNVLTSPQIDVRVVAFNADRVEVTGEVAKPGTIYLNNTPKGILEAIDSTGGLTLAASRRRLTLVRGGKSYRIDLGALLSGSRPIANPGLLPGDVVHVPDQSGDQVFVLGAVTKQQPVTIQQDSMSLIQALTEAGGLDALSAKQSGVFVFRARGEGDQVRTTVYALDLSHPESMLLAGAFKLLPRDVVYVQATDFSQYNAIVNQILPTVTTIYELNALHQFIK
jgi:polysaccharide export outer membrane protein